MLYDLLRVDLRNFNIRAVPDSAAKTDQKVLSLRGTELWLYEALQEGVIGHESWQETGITVGKDHAYEHYKVFSKQRHEWTPAIKAMWSKKIRDALGSNVSETRPTIDGSRVRLFQFAPLADCRRQFAIYLGVKEIKWEPESESEAQTNALRKTFVEANLGRAVDISPPLEGALSRGIDQAAADLELVRRST